MPIIKIASLLIAGMLMSSCSIYMAANQSRRDLAILTEGTPQSLVREEFGNPVWSGKDSQGFDVEIFQFVQGYYSRGARAAMVLWHTAADTFSFGIWELIGFQIESRHGNTKMNAIVTYDEEQRVKSGRLRDEHDNEIPLEKKSEEEAP
jgi:hypothetical protein